MSIESAISTGTLIILVYTLLVGFWAVSVTDTLEGILMVATAVFLSLFALSEVGGLSSLISALPEVYSATQLSFVSDFYGWTAVAFVIGMPGVGLGNPRQPHLLNRFMAIEKDKDKKIAKLVGIG